MIIGIIGAMDIEIKKLKEKLNNTTIEKIASMNFYTGIIDNTKVVICNCFEGKVNAAVGTELLISKFNVSCIINIGVAGGVSDKLNICDIAVANSTVEYDLDTTALGYELGYVFGLNKVKMICDENISSILYNLAKQYGNAIYGTIATSDKFVSSEYIKDSLTEKFDAIAVDMETASICHVCNLNNIPFGAVRAISDNCSNMEYKEFLDLALDKLDKIICDYIKLLNN